jgi:hypothetical protein
MKAKNQKLVKSVLKFLNKRNELWTKLDKEELQVLADRFIDHHDRKIKVPKTIKEVVHLDLSEKEPKADNEAFKVGAKVECMEDEGFGSVGFIESETTDEGYFNVLFYTPKLNHFKGVKHYSVLKLLPND